MQISPLKIVYKDESIQEILAGMKEALSTGMLAQGKYVSEFERQWAEYVGAKHAVAVSSGSSAIEMAVRILGVQGKEVLVPIAHCRKTRQTEVCRTFLSLPAVSPVFSIPGVPFSKLQRLGGCAT